MESAKIINLFDEFLIDKSQKSDTIVVYEIGSYKITFMRPFSLKKIDLHRLMKNQFISQAVAVEYNKSQTEYNEIMDNLTRENAVTAFELKLQQEAKLEELNGLTVEYLEILSNLSAGELEKIITSSLPQTLKATEFSEFINDIFKNVTKLINAVEPVENDGVVFDQQKKVSTSEQPNTQTEQLTNSTQSEDSTNYLVMSV